MFFAFAQKTYAGSPKDISYLFQKGKKSNRLIVVFSGFAGRNVPGRYNYIKTMQSNTDNKLFILDDDGYNHVGTYYLGQNCAVFKSDEISELIRKIVKEHQIEDVAFCGSSKGGSAALI